MRKAYNYIVNLVKIFLIRKRIKNKKASIDEIVKSKFNFIGTSKQKNRGMKLYTFDPITEHIAEVPMIVQNDANIRAFLNPDHPMLWAINYKNAERKFKANSNEKQVVD